MGSRHQAGNELSAVSPVDAEIRIGGDQAMLSASLRFCGERNRGGQAGTLAFQLSSKMWPIKSLTFPAAAAAPCGRCNRSRTMSDFDTRRDCDSRSISRTSGSGVGVIQELAAASFVVDRAGETVHGNLNLVTVDTAILIGWQALAADLHPGVEGSIHLHFKFKFRHPPPCHQAVTALIRLRVSSTSSVVNMPTVIASTRRLVKTYLRDASFSSG
jgi:hypothetical protein